VESGNGAGSWRGVLWAQAGFVSAAASRAAFQRLFKGGLRGSGLERAGHAPQACGRAALFRSFIHSMMS